MHIKEVTEQLINNLHLLKNSYENGEAPENRRDKAFFEKVKRETYPIFDLLERWEVEALQLVKQRKISLHPQQIDSTKDNMEALIMHSYYHDARKKRYMEIYHSSLYIFEQMVNDLERNEQEAIKNGTSTID